MKRFFSLVVILLFLINISLKSQKVYCLVPKGDEIKDQGLYRNAIVNILKKDSLNIADYYNIAGCYSLLENKDSAFYFLNIYVDITRNDMHGCVLLDTDFDYLRKTNKWKKINSKIEKKYLDEYNPQNKKLSVELWRLGLEDQRYRGYLYIQRNVEYRDMAKLDNKNIQKRFIKILENNPFPSFSEVGRLAGEYSFLLLQHCDPIIICKYVDVLGELAKKGEATATNWAKVHDRCLICNDKPQKFGTQARCELISIYDEIYEKGICVLYPLEDITRVNEWRKEVGFDTTVEEECEKKGYIINE